MKNTNKWNQTLKKLSTKYMKNWIWSTCNQKVKRIIKKLKMKRNSEKCKNEFN